MLATKQIEDYLSQNTSAEDYKLSQLREETYSSTTAPHMLSGHVQGKFLGMLVALTNAKRIIEVGTFTGYATLAMAQYTTEDAKIYTLDINENHISIARKYFAQSPHGHKIESILAPAIDSINSLDETFDLAFIDAEKSGYPAYFEALLPKMKIGGLMVFDNMLFKGEVLDPQSKSAIAINNTNKMITKNPNVENVLLPLRDGLQLARRIS